MVSQKPPVKEEKVEVQGVKANVGRIGKWSIPSISSARRVSFEVDAARKKGTGVPTRVSPRFVVEAPAEPEEEDEDRNERFSTPGWGGEESRVQAPRTSTPRSVLKRKDKVVIELQDEDEQERVQKDREEVLKEVIIEKNKGTKKPNYVVPPKDKNKDKSGIADIWQKLMDHKVTVTIEDICTLNPEAAKKHLGEKLGMGEDVVEQSIMFRSAGGRITSKGKGVEDVVLSEGLRPEEVYEYLQHNMNNLYSCPLGYIEVKVGEHGMVRVTLLDSRSQINLMTEKQAKELGLEVQVGIDMKLVGIANNVA
ncbi:hypothetical protein CROQUDRAFT_136778, partial [Cronartium quercuum f. sp. fusiforme G11]